MINIEVFGPGCARCQATKEAIRNALVKAGVEATITHVSDPKEIAKNRVFFTPAVRIDGEMKSTGRVPSLEEVCQWLFNRVAS